MAQRQQSEDPRGIATEESEEFSSPADDMIVHREMSTRNFVAVVLTVGATLVTIIFALGAFMGTINATAAQVVCTAYVASLGVTVGFLFRNRQARRSRGNRRNRGR